jgi:hypothetical protein
MRAISSSSQGLTLWGGHLQVDELGPIAGQGVLVLQAGQLLARRDPPVALPVQADEDVALLQVGTVGARGGCGPART